MFIPNYFLTSKKSENRTAKLTLFLLLLITLAINISNLISSTYLYRMLPQIAGFARGMVLLLGPLFYFYIRSVVDPSFEFRFKQIFHIGPYILAVVLIRIQMIGVSNDLYISTVDALMAGNVKMTFLASTWFICYFIHLSVYLGLSLKLLKRSIQNANDHYQISITDRVRWIRHLIIVFIVLTILFLGISTYSIVTESYSINGNFIYVSVLAIMVYLIAYQAILSKAILTPNFAKKYGKTSFDKDAWERIRSRFYELLEKEKIFTDPDIRVAHLAKSLNVKPHVLSRFINTEFNKSFNELINHYRVEEFKLRVTDEKYHHFSIMGIAYDVGYNSKSAFNTSFRKHTGQTPSEFMRKHTTKN